MGPLDWGAVGPAKADNDPRSDEALIAALNRGDLSAFDGLYYRYRDWVVALAYRFTHHDADSLDVLQETFAYLFGKFPGFVLTARMTTFLYPVVKNLSIAAKRRRARHTSEEPAGGDPAAPPPPSDPADVRGELAAAMASLPDAQREVVLMRFVDDMSLMEIAQALAIPEGTVKSRLHNAIATLRSDPRARAHFDH